MAAGSHLLLRNTIVSDNAAGEGGAFNVNFGSVRGP